MPKEDLLGCIPIALASDGFLLSLVDTLTESPALNCISEPRGARPRHNAAVFDFFSPTDERGGIFQLVVRKDNQLVIAMYTNAYKMNHLFTPPLLHNDKNRTRAPER